MISFEPVAWFILMMVMMENTAGQNLFTACCQTNEVETGKQHNKIWVSSSFLRFEKVSSSSSSSSLRWSNQSVQVTWYYSALFWSQTIDRCQTHHSLSLSLPSILQSHPTDSHTSDTLLLYCRTLCRLNCVVLKTVAHQRQIAYSKTTLLSKLKTHLFHRSYRDSDKSASVITYSSHLTWQIQTNITT